MKSKSRAQLHPVPDSAPIISQLAAESRAASAIPKDSLAERITQELAYQLYQERGSVDGHDWQDWFEAECILRERRKLAA